MKGLLQRPRHAVHGDLPLLHGLQERRLRARRRPVDLVRHDDLVKDGSGAELEFPRLLVEHGHTRDVRREQVRRALHA